MVALADLMKLRPVRGNAFALASRRKLAADRCPTELVELSSQSVRGRAANSLVPGEIITIGIPALGGLSARVTAADEREFRAEFCGPSDLRLLFLRPTPVDCRSWYERFAD